MTLKKTASLFLRIKIVAYRWIKHLEYVLQLLLNKIVRSQLRNTKSIPIIIINFNQLLFLKNLIDDLTVRKHENIVVIDNNSNYPPLLKFYEIIEKEPNITIERMEKNYGHRVFFENEDLQQKYGQGYYIITDSDINFYKNMPVDFMRKLLKLLNKNHQKVTKIGLALNIDDIPDYYNQKKKVINWEGKFWRKPVMNNVYDAPIDTTFALYLPGFPRKNNKNGFYRALRVGGEYTVKHGGWYQNSENPSDEHLYYLNSANNSYSWKTNEKGDIISDLKEKY